MIENWRHPSHLERIRSLVHRHPEFPASNSVGASKPSRARRSPYPCRVKNHHNQAFGWLLANREVSAVERLADSAVVIGTNGESSAPIASCTVIGASRSAKTGWLRCSSVGRNSLACSLSSRGSVGASRHTVFGSQESPTKSSESEFTYGQSSVTTGENGQCWIGRRISGAASKQLDVVTHIKAIEEFLCFVGICTRVNLYKDIHCS